MTQQLSHEVATGVTEASHASLNHILANLPTFLHVPLAYEHLIQPCRSGDDINEHDSISSDKNASSLKLACEEHSTATSMALLDAFRRLPAHNCLELDSVRIRSFAASDPSTAQDVMLFNHVMCALKCHTKSVIFYAARCCADDWQSILSTVADNASLETLEVLECAAVNANGRPNRRRQTRPIPLSAAAYSPARCFGELVVDSLAKLTSLHTLRLEFDRNQLRRTEFATGSLIHYLSRLSRLTSLWLTATGLDLRRFSPALSKLVRLQFMHLTLHCSSDVHIKVHAMSFAESVGKLTALTSLQISISDRVGSSSVYPRDSDQENFSTFADVLLPPLRNLCELQSLSLDLAKPMSTTSIALFCTLYLQIGMLKVLRLWLDVLDMSTSELSRMLKDAGQLTELKLCIVNGRVAYIRQMCSQLYHIPTLQNLHLQLNHVVVEDYRPDRSRELLTGAALSSLSSLSSLCFRLGLSAGTSGCVRDCLCVPELLNSVELRQLELSSPSVLSSMVQSSNHGTSVQHLRLTQCRMNIEEARAAGSFVASLTRLTFLDLTSMFDDHLIGNVGGFFSAVPELRSLRHLVIRGSYLLSSNAADFGAALSRMHELRVLIVNRCRLHELVMPVDAESLRASDAHEQCDHGAEALMCDIASLKQLRQLEFSYTEMSESSAQTLAVSLKQMTCLTNLSLNGNHAIEGSVLISVVDSLMLANSLKCLHLLSVGMDKEGAAAVAELLSTVTSLRKVVVGGSEFDAEGAAVLLAALPEEDPLRCAELAQICRQKIPLLRSTVT